MSRAMISDVIQCTFNNLVGKWQVKKNPQEALLIQFRTKTNFDKEEGYRYLDLLVYGPMNYVQVWWRRRWCVIPQEYLEDDGMGDVVVSKGKKYDEGQGDWQTHNAHGHDSGWRDTIGRFLDENAKDILGFDKLGDTWYKIIPVPHDLPSVFEP